MSDTEAQKRRRIASKVQATLDQEVAKNMAPARQAHREKHSGFANKRRNPTPQMIAAEHRKRANHARQQKDWQDQMNHEAGGSCSKVNRANMTAEIERGDEFVAVLFVLKFSKRRCSVNLGIGITVNEAINVMKRLHCDMGSPTGKLIAEEPLHEVSVAQTFKHDRVGRINFIPTKAYRTKDDLVRLMKADGWMIVSEPMPGMGNNDPAHVRAAREERNERVKARNV